MSMTENTFIMYTNKVLTITVVKDDYSATATQIII